MCILTRRRSELRNEAPYTTARTDHLADARCQPTGNGPGLPPLNRAGKPRQRIIAPRYKTVAYSSNGRGQLNVTNPKEQAKSTEMALKIKSRRPMTADLVYAIRNYHRCPNADIKIERFAALRYHYHYGNFSGQLDRWTTYSPTSTGQTACGTHPAIKVGGATTHIPH